ncbi:MAG TPA: RNA-binding protein, partial [Anaerolineales bacterium]|nr:RNA-binding protein [Anaerolineales bacterium]
MEARLYVGNLPYSTTEEELRDLFAQAGEVKSVAVIKDRDSGRSKGFAFVEMGSQADAEAAIARFNNAPLGNRNLTVNIARPREDRPRDFGGGGGGFGGGGGGFGGGRGGFGGGGGGGRGGDRRRGGGDRDRR